MEQYPIGDQATIGELLDRAIEMFGERTAYVSDGERISYRELGRRVDTVARAFLAERVGRGSKVAIWMPNQLYWILSYLAAVRVGAAVVPINTSFTLDEAFYVIEHSDAEILIVGSQSRGKSTAQEVLVRRSQVQGARLRSIIVIDGKNYPGTASVSEFLRNGEFISDQALESAFKSVEQDDLALLLYTSGTTGFPKGAMHTHKVILNMRDVGMRLALCEDDTLVLYLPLFHVFAGAAVISFLYAGGRIVLMSKFDARDSMFLIQEERATIVYGMHTMYYDQLNHPDFQKFDLSSVRLCVGPGTGDLIRRLSEEMGKGLNVYGMTETTSMTTLPYPGDPLDLRADTVGYPLPGFEVKILDADGREVDRGDSGEIVVRGHPVMLGYYKRPDATAEVLSEDGWFRTGDAGSLTADGYLRYRGRIKDLVRVGGENVDPSEVEAVLMAQPGVAMAAAVGEPDERLVEVVVAFVKLLEGATVSEQQLIDQCWQRLARFKVPRRIYFVEQFPTTASGKIKKFELRNIDR
jgi:fatty-acyl-CoA synthase